MAEYLKSKKFKANIKRMQAASRRPEVNARRVATRAATMAARQLKGKPNGEIQHSKKTHGDIQEATTAARILGRIEGFIEGYAEARGLSRSRLRSWVAQRLAGEGERGEDF